MTNPAGLRALDDTTIAAIADDLDRLADALEDRGIAKSRIAGLMYAAAPAITTWELEQGRLIRGDARSPAWGH